MFATLVFFSCEETFEPAIIDSKGVVRGHVALNASFESSGVRVTLRGVSYNRTLLTPASGDYAFGNVPTSNLDLEFFKEGYGLMKIYNISQSGLDTILMDQVGLYEIPQHQIRTLVDFFPGVENNGNPFLQLNFLHEPNLPSGRIFFSRDADVSCRNYEVSAFVDNNVERDYQRIYFSQTTIKKFSDNTKIYFKIYPNGGGAYFDYVNDLFIYSSVNEKLASETFAFIFPE